MKQPKLGDVKIDRKGTKRLRSQMARPTKIKITINVDEDSLAALRKMSGKSGVPYQTLLNQVLKEGLDKRKEAETRLDKLERELEKLKKKVAA